MLRRFIKDLIAINVRKRKILVPLKGLPNSLFRRQASGPRAPGLIDIFGNVAPGSFLLLEKGLSN